MAAQSPTAAMLGRVADKVHRFEERVRYVLLLVAFPAKTGLSLDSCHNWVQEHSILTHD